MAPTTASEINEWFREEITKLKTNNIFGGDFADQLFSHIEEDLCYFSEGDNVAYCLESLYDYSSDTFTWLYDSLTSDELASLIIDEDNVDTSLWMSTDGEGLSFEERLTRSYIDYITRETVNFFRMEWLEQFQKDPFNVDPPIIAQ